MYFAAENKLKAVYCLAKSKDMNAPWYNKRDFK